MPVLCKRVAQSQVVASWTPRHVASSAGRLLWVPVVPMDFWALYFLFCDTQGGCKACPCSNRPPRLDVDRTRGRRLMVAGRNWVRLGQANGRLLRLWVDPAVPSYSSRPSSLTRYGRLVSHLQRRHHPPVGSAVLVIGRAMLLAVSLLL